MKQCFDDNTSDGLPAVMFATAMLVLVSLAFFGIYTIVM